MLVGETARQTIFALTCGKFIYFFWNKRGFAAIWKFLKKSKNAFYLKAMHLSK